MQSAGDGDDLTALLPDELLRIVLVLLPPTAVFQCSRVCRRWHATITDSILLRKRRFLGRWAGYRDGTLTPRVLSLDVFRRGHEGVVQTVIVGAVSVGSDGTIYASGSYVLADNMPQWVLWVWNGRTGEFVRTINHYDGLVHALAVGQSDNDVYIGDQSLALTRLSHTHDRPIWSKTLFSSVVTCISFSTDGLTVYVAASTGVCTVTTDGTVLVRFQARLESNFCYRTLVISPDGVMYGKGTLHINASEIMHSSMERWSTTGESCGRHIQPFFADTLGGTMSMSCGRGGVYLTDWSGGLRRFSPKLGGWDTVVASPVGERADCFAAAARDGTLAMLRSDLLMAVVLPYEEDALLGHGAFHIKHPGAPDPKKTVRAFVGPDHMVVTVVGERWSDISERGGQRVAFPSFFVW
eukprot:m.24692 g.24692  ORF g.24692 m.24692 type:complete len:410 (-) comp6106_c0_seq1:57-1286(-)